MTEQQRNWLREHHSLVDGEWTPLTTFLDFQREFRLEAVKAWEIIEEFVEETT